MFDPRSRYAGLKTGTLTIEERDGTRRAITYVRRRFRPTRRDDVGVQLVDHTVAPGERIDLIAARYLGDPRLFWQIADANDPLDPGALAARAGATVRVAVKVR